MPALVWWILGGLAAFLPRIIAAVLVWLTVGTITTAGIEYAVAHWLENGAQAMMAHTPSTWIQFAVFMELPWCLSMIMGGVAVRALLAGWSNGTRLGRLVK